MTTMYTQTFLEGFFGTDREDVSIALVRPADAASGVKNSLPHPNLDALLSLRCGWDGDGASPPSRLAVETAKSVCDAFQDEMIAFSRVAPSVVGGVGLTIKKRGRKFYVEVLNNGDVYAMESELTRTPHVYPVRASYRDYSTIAASARDFLNV